MRKMFPYIFSTTFNTVASSMDFIENIIDNVVNNFVNSDFMSDLISGMDSITSSVDIDFREHKRGYTLECYLPGVKKENIDLEYNNNYITIKIKRNMFYTNNKNIAMAVIQSGGDIEEDYYVENADIDNIRAVFKNDTLKVIVPKSTYIAEDTTIIEVDSYKA